MADKNRENLLKIYNPWWDDTRGPWRDDLPDYERPIVKDVLKDLVDLSQMISVTGPRRVGKTTAARQVV